MATEKAPSINIEQLISEQVEMQKNLREKRKEFRDMEKKNREMKSLISSSLNLPMGVSVVIRKAV